MTEHRYVAGRFTFSVYIPEGFDSPPTDVVSALRAAKQVLVEEDRWVRCTWYDNDDPTLDLNTPFCNSWKVCAEGAVAMVTAGAHIDTEALARSLESATYHSWDFNPGYAENLAQRFDLYRDVCEILFQAGEQLWPEIAEPEAAWRFNDSMVKDRAEAIRWFDFAIELAERVPA